MAADPYKGLNKNQRQISRWIEQRRTSLAWIPGKEQDLEEYRQKLRRIEKRRRAGHAAG